MVEIIKSQNEDESIKLQAGSEPKKDYPKMNFFELAAEIDQKYVQALKVFAKVKNGNEEKTREEWHELLSKMLNKKTT